VNPDVRVGLGTDRHPLREGPPLILAGETVPSERGGVGHSDADAAAHAAIDALLGAIGEGDIGELFPPSEERWKDADSLDLLRRTGRRLEDGGYRPVNLDLTIRLEAVELASHREAMQNNLREALPGDPAVNVKFKRGETMGPVGRGEAVEALCVVLVRALEAPE